MTKIVTSVALPNGHVYTSDVDLPDDVDFEYMLELVWRATIAQIPVVSFTCSTLPHDGWCSTP